MSNISQVNVQNDNGCQTRKRNGIQIYSKNDFEKEKVDLLFEHNQIALLWLH